MKATRLASVRMRAPGTPAQRTITRKHIPYTGDIDALIAGATALVSERRPCRWALFVMNDPAEGNAPVPWSLEIDFGFDQQGARTTVNVELTCGDIPNTVRHILRFKAAKIVGVVAVELPAESEGDGGEQLPVPSMSDVQLAELSISVMVH